LQHPFVGSLLRMHIPRSGRFHDHCKIIYSNMILV
jgi:hypothetical protein